VLLLLNHEYAYKNDYNLPNSNPKCPQLVVPYVYFIQTGALEIVKGSNLNKCCPVHDDDEVL
jgi:hypothetical protein